MAFPYNDQDQILTQQAILAGVAGVSGGQGVLRVSSLTAGGSITLDGDATNNRVSAIQGAANLLRTSSFVDSGSVSAKSNDAAQLRVSAFSQDAGLLRMSAVGGTAGDNTIVDGVDNTVSARIKQISAVLSASDNAFIVHVVSEGAARNNVSAKSNDASTLRISAFSNDGATNRVSAIVDNGSVSAKSNDAAQFRVSAFIDSGSVSAKQGDAALLRISGILDSGSVSAKSNDAAQLRVSSFSNDGATMLVSAKSGDGNQLHTSSVQGDAALLRVSALQSVVTTNTGGASYYMVSSGATSQVSTVKSSAGRLYGYHIGNPAGVDQYLQVFNTSGGATAGTDTPALTLYVPTLGGAVMSLGAGIAFSAGMQVIGTSTANGQTIGASAMRINLFYA